MEKRLKELKQQLIDDQVEIDRLEELNHHFKQVEEERENLCNETSCKRN